MKISQYAGMSGFFWNRGLPSYLILFVTARCPARCPHCFYWEAGDRAEAAEELTLDEFRKIATGMGYVGYLTVTGGEPFLRDDLPEIFHQFYTRCGTRFAGLPTSGYFPERIEDLTARILESCPKLHLKVPLSLDGVGALHDAIRGEGGFEMLRESHRRLVALAARHPGLEVAVNTTLSRLNQDQIEEIVIYAHEVLGITTHTLTLARGRARQPDTLQVDPNAYQRAVEMLAEVDRKRNPTGAMGRVMRRLRQRTREVIEEVMERGRMPVDCVAGRDLAVISETGEVFPCELISHSMGNLRQHDYRIDRILAGDAAKAITADIRRKGCSCTFECAITQSLIHEWREYPALVAAFLNRAGR